MFSPLYIVGWSVFPWSPSFFVQISVVFLLRVVSDAAKCAEICQAAAFILSLYSVYHFFCVLVLRFRTPQPRAATASNNVETLLYPDVGGALLFIGAFFGPDDVYLSRSGVNTRRVHRIVAAVEFQYVICGAKQALFFQNTWNRHVAREAATWHA